MEFGLYKSFKHKKTGNELPPLTVVIGNSYYCDHVINKGWLERMPVSLLRMIPSDAIHELITKINENVIFDGYLEPQLANFISNLWRVEMGDCLFISDIESGIHPKKQAMLLEGIAALVNMGVKALILTYSPYVMAHLNNLTNWGGQDTWTLNRRTRSLYLQDKRAFLVSDLVGAYEIKSNELVPLRDRDHGIRYDTLSDVSVELQQEFFAINS